MSLNHTKYLSKMLQQLQQIEERAGDKILNVQWRQQRKKQEEDSRRNKTIMEYCKNEKNQRTRKR